MRKQNNDKELLEKLQSMPIHTLAPAAKSRLFNNIKEETNRYEKKYVRNRMVKRLSMGFVCCAVLLLFSLTAFTPQGRDYTGRLWSQVFPQSENNYNATPGSSDTSTNNTELNSSNPSSSDTNTTDTGLSSPTPSSSDTNTAVSDNAQSPSIFSEITPKSISMMDEKSGWAVGDKHIIHTTDGGITWKDVTPNGAEGPYTGSYFLDDMNGWVTTPASPTSEFSQFNIYSTSDGGTSWKKAVSPVEGFGAYIQFLNSKSGFILVGQGAAAGSEEVTVLKSEDGGASWMVLSKTDPQNSKPGDIPFGGTKFGITFANTSNGFIAGFSPADGHAYVYVTNDGGVTWKDANLTIPPEFKDAQLSFFPPVFFTGQDGIMPVNPGSGDRSIFFYITHDVGKTWSYGTQIKPAEGRELRWSIIDANNIAASDGKTIYKTADGGKTWTSITLNMSFSNITDIDFVSGNIGYIVSSGSLYNTNDGGRTWNPVVTEK